MTKAKLIGIISDVFPTEDFHNFSKRVFWLQEPDREQYPQHWEVELHNDDVKQLNVYHEGDLIEAEVEIRGKRWSKAGKHKIFNSLKCVGIRLITKGAGS
jgi:hypothetical protein